MDYSSGIRSFVSGLALPAIRLVRGGECTGQSDGSFPYQTFKPAMKIKSQPIACHKAIRTYQIK